LHGIGPPARGLFLFGRGPASSKKEIESQPIGKVEPITTSHGSWELPLNPYSEALRVMEKLENDLRILSTFRGEGARTSLGSQIDVRA
jgi:hypothetical protein